MGVWHMYSKLGMNFDWSTNFHSESAWSYSAPFGKTRSEIGYSFAFQVNLVKKMIGKSGICDINFLDECQP